MYGIGNVSYHAGYPAPKELDTVIILMLQHSKLSLTFWITATHWVLNNGTYLKELFSSIWNISAWIIQAINKLKKIKMCLLFIIIAAFWTKAKYISRKKSRKTTNLFLENKYNWFGCVGHILSIWMGRNLLGHTRLPQFLTLNTSHSIQIQMVSIKVKSIIYPFPWNSEEKSQFFWKYCYFFCVLMFSTLSFSYSN